MHRPTLVTVAVLGALARIIMLLEIPLPFFPGFLKLDFSDLVPLLGAFALGLRAGIGIEAVKCLLHLPAGGSFGIGELVHFLVGSAFVAVSAGLYRRFPSRRGLLAGLICGLLAMTAAGALVNYFLALPLYARVLGWETEALVALGAALFPAIHDKGTLILYSLVPFNLLKGTLLSLLALPLARRVKTR